ncbi:MAG: hypothetical protein JST24_01225 [Acidobacteria bacterium]|nr:hypothetical protein [Acidobacteriota bacterium]
MAGSQGTGTLDWTVAATYKPAQGSAQPAVAPASNLVTINGTATVGGITVTLSGTFDANNPTASNAVQVSGASSTPVVAYTFTGSASGGMLSGAWSSDAGGSGTWSVLYVPSGGSVEVYTGSFANDDASDNGYFNIEISSDGHVSANYASTDDPDNHGMVSGSVGTAATSTTPGTFGADIFDKSGSKIGTITAGQYSLGTNHTGQVSGTYSVGSPATSGAFSGNN